MYRVIRLLHRFLPQSLLDWGYRTLTKLQSIRRSFNRADRIPKPRRQRFQKTSSELREYRKRIHIYDTFVFFNELDVLELRLNILNPYVDFFVLLEASETFTGHPKKLFYHEYRNRFREFEHKIIHYVCKLPKDEAELRSWLYQDTLDDLDREIILNTLTTDNVPRGASQWMREFYQKELLKKALVELRDDDFCYISDVDEIWNPLAPIDYSLDDVYKYKQDAYYYYLNNRSNDDWKTGWVGTVATKYRNVRRGCVNHLRTASKAHKTQFTTVENGGWHFTFQGGAEAIRQKLESYGHAEFNTRSIKDNLETVIAANRDYRGRRLKFWLDESRLPQYIIEHKSKYAHLFRQ